MAARIWTPRIGTKADGTVSGRRPSADSYVDHGDRPSAGSLTVIRWLVAMLCIASCPAFAKSQELVVQTGHNSDIMAVAINHSNTLLASAEYTGNRFTLWDLQSRREIRTVASDSEVTSLSFSPDGSALAVATEFATITLIDPNSGNVLRTVQPKSAGVVLDPTSGRFVSLDSLPPSEQGPLVQRPINYQMPIAFRANGDLAGATPFSKDGVLYWGINIWDATGTLKFRLFQTDANEDGGSAITAFAFSQDGQWIAATRFDGAVEVWDVASHQRLKLFPGKFFNPSNTLPTSVVFNPSKQDLVISSYEALSTIILNLSSGSVRTLSTPVITAEFTSDGSTLLAGVGQSVVFLDPTSLQPLRSAINLGSSTESVRTITRLSGDLYVVTCSHNFYVLNTSTNHAISLFEARAEPLNALALSPDNSTLLLAEHNAIRQWDLKSGRLLASPITVGSEVRSLTFSPDGKWLLSFSALADQQRIGGVLQAFSFPAGQPIWSQTLDGAESPCISPSGKYVAVLIKRGTVRILDSTTGTATDEIRVAQGLASDAVPNFDQDIASVVYSIDFVSDELIAATGTNPSRPIRTILNGTLATGQPYTVSEPDNDPHLPAIQLWNIGTNERVFFAATQDDGPMANISVAPSAERVATSYPEGDTVHIWDLKSETETSSIPSTGSQLAFDATGNLLASGDRVGTVVLKDLQTGALREIKVGSSVVSQLAFSSDGKTLIIAVDDGGVQLWNLPDLTLRATFFFSGDRSLVVTPDHYYFAEAGLFDFVSFRYGNRAYSVDQFDLQFNRPDKVLAALGFPDQGTINAYEAAYANREGVAHSSPTRPASTPVVRIRTDLPLYTTDKEISATIEASDQNADLAKLQVYNNGVPILGRQGLSITSLHKRSYATTIHITLTAGSNYLQFSATDTDGLESLREPFEVTLDATPPKQHLVIVAVGISHYRDGTESLTYPAKDATDFDSFITHGWSNQLAQEGTIVVDQAASRSGILALKNRIFKMTQPDDTVIMLIAGHGVLDEHLKYYFAPYDMNFSRYSAYGISIDDIETLFDGISARHKLVLIDTCHAGNVEFAKTAPEKAAQSGVTVIRPTATTQVTDQVFLEEAFISLRWNSGVIAIGASAGSQQAIESSTLHNGAFTFAVLEGLGRNPQGTMLADENGDGTVSVSELRDYVGRTVEALTHGQQTPLLWSGPDEYDFPVLQTMQK